MYQKLQKYGDGVPESLEDKKYFFVEVRLIIDLKNKGRCEFLSDDEANCILVN